MSCETPKQYEYTDAMHEISGFGGGYEAACRAMVVAGLEFWDQQPASFDPHYRGFKGVYGICLDDNEDAKALDNAVVAGAAGDCTGAMHQAAISHILFIRKNGWQKYVEEMSKPDEDTADAR